MGCWNWGSTLHKPEAESEVKVLVTQSCPTLCDPMDCSPPGSSVRGILQARILDRVAMPSSRGSSPPRDWAQVACTAGRFFTIWATQAWIWGPQILVPNSDPSSTYSVLYSVNIYIYILLSKYLLSVSLCVRTQYWAWQRKDSGYSQITPIQGINAWHNVL